MIAKEIFGRLSTGEEISKFTLSTSQLTVEILDYGAIIKSVTSKPDNTDFVLGYDNLAGYEADSFYFGCAVGRHSGRINPVTINLEGVEYSLEKNSGENNLHGGSKGLNKRLFAGSIHGDHLVLTTRIEHLDDGFPGNLDVTIIYSIENENELKIKYKAVSDKDTIINLTNHSYFNLSGHGSGSIKNQKLWLNSNYYLSNNASSIPIKMLPTKDTALDFTVAKALEEAISSEEQQVIQYGGIDNVFLLNGEGIRKVASLEGDSHKMEVFTDQTAIVVYTANQISSRPNFKEDANYGVHGGVCLETQNVPNAVNMPWIKSPVYKKGEEYQAATVFKFSVK